MSKLLINENPLVVLPSLAVVVGLNQALFLQQVHYWLQTSKKIHDGKKWTYNTIDEWQAQFPFFSRSTLERAIAKLVEIGVLIVDKLSSVKSDRTNYYTIDYEKLDSLVNKNESTITSNCGDHHVKLTESTITSNCGDVTETSNKISTDTKKSEKEKIEQLTTYQPKNGQFKITFAWRPSDDFKTRCQMAGKDHSKFHLDILLDFINYNEAKEIYRSQKEWEALLLTYFSKELTKPNSSHQQKNFNQQGGNVQGYKIPTQNRTPKTIVDKNEKARLATELQLLEDL